MKATGIWLWAAAVLVAFVALFPLSRPTKQMPIRVVDGQIRDLGNVQAGAPFSERFRIRNVTEQEVLIGTVRKSCACFVAEVTQNPVPPGEHFDVVIGGLIPKGNERAVVQTVVSVMRPVKFDFPLTLKYKALDKVSFSPRQLSSLGTPGTEVNRMIRLTGWHEQISDLKLQFPVSVVASRKIGDDETGQTWEVSLRHPQSQGVQNVEIQAHTRDGECEATLPVRLVTEYPVSIVPGSLLIRRSNSDLTGRSVTISSRTPFTVESIVCDEKLLGVIALPSMTEIDSSNQCFAIVPKDRAIREDGSSSHKIRFNVAQDGQEMPLEVSVVLID